MPSRNATPLDREILHFTHIDNLGQILAEGALYPDVRVGSRLVTEIGDRSIKAARRRNLVTCGPGGHPADYVPFYFAPRSPMMYRIACGSVDHYHDGQTPLIYLVSTVGDVASCGLRWVFSNGNCGCPQGNVKFAACDHMWLWVTMGEAVANHAGSFHSGGGLMVPITAC